MRFNSGIRGRSVPPDPLKYSHLKKILPFDTFFSDKKLKSRIRGRLGHFVHLTVGRLTHFLNKNTRNKIPFKIFLCFSHVIDRAHLYLRRSYKPNGYNICDMLFWTFFSSKLVKTGLDGESNIFSNIICNFISYEIFLLWSFTSKNLESIIQVGVEF